jgi:hypothetical protein
MSEQEHVILTTLFLAGAKNTNSWCAMKGDLQCSFHLHILMAPSSSIIVTVNGEHQMCGGFSLGETIHFGSLEFIFDYLSGLRLSPVGDGSDAVTMGSAHGRPVSPWWTMMGDSAEEFPMAPVGEGMTNLPSPRRHDVEATSASTTTITQPENLPNDQATTTTTPW